jgi:hypothetical protein
LDGTTESATAVKRAVIRSLRSVDRRVSVEATDYFNHSYAPDLVLKWPHLPARPERQVFLRFNEKPGWIADDLALIGRRHPVVYGLAPTEWLVDADELTQRSVATETLVTDPAGVDQLAAQPEGIEGLVGRTMIRGGQGIIDRSRAAWVTSTIAAGFEGAKSADLDTTHLATDAATEFLRPAESSLVVGFLQAMWVGAGGETNDFPVPSSQVNDPGNEGLAFLINQDEIADEAFWRSLGISLSLERLIQLGVDGAPTNLQHLVRANLDRLWARACRVKREQPRLGESGGLRWRIEARLLALSGNDFIAYFGARSKQLKRIKPDTGAVSISVQELRRRAVALAAVVDNLELTNGERLLTWASADQTDVSADERIDTIAETLGTATLRKATIYVGERNLDLDFPTATISARTQGQPPLADIVREALPLLWAMTDEERDELREMSAVDERQQLELFARPELTVTPGPPSSSNSASPKRSDTLDPD